MDPESVQLVGALLGTTGLAGVGAALVRRRGGDPSSAATEVRDAAPGLAALATSLARSTERVAALEARVDALEARVWRCPVRSCPVRDQLRQEHP